MRDPSTSPPPPSPADAVPAPASDGRSVLARLVIVLSVAAVLSSQSLVGVAESLPFGRTRTALVAVARSVDDAASSAQLHRPRRLVDDALDRTGDGAPSAAPPATAPPTPGSGPRGRSTPATSARRSPTTTVTSSPPTTDGRAQPVQPVEPVERPLRAIDGRDRLRLWAGGDSLGEYVGNQLRYPIADAELTDVELDYHISTGLARPDYFDWAGRMRELMRSETPPEALVFMVGGNDDQNMIADGSVLDAGSPEWYLEYGNRVASIMDTVNTGASHLYWIGLPPMRDDDRNEIALEVNVILRHAAEARPWVSYLDIETLFAGPGGDFSPSIADPDGQPRIARAPDGVHITFVGSTWVAERVWSAIGHRWSLVDALSSPRPEGANWPSTGPPL